MFKRSVLVRSLGSIRLALWLLCAIILISFAGAVAPAEVQPKIFYSWWFLAVLALFGINVLACLSGRLMFSGGVGSKLTHASILVILAGSLVSFLFTERGRLELAEGEERSAFIGEKAMVRLGFSVKLEDFEVEWYRPRYFKLGVVSGEKRRKIDAVPGKEYRVGDHAFVVREYYPHFAMNEEGKPVNLSDRALNPALLVELVAPEGAQRRWVFGRLPGLNMGGDGDIRFVLLDEPGIREFRSHVSFSSGGQRQERVIKVNTPAVFGGYTFYQTGYDQDNPDWTSLEVVRDPGAPVVFAGFLMLNAGVAMIYAGRWLAGRKK